MIAFSQNKNGETYHTYGYTNAAWSDLLTSFDGGTITYDAIGNPLTYHDGKTFTWTAGRKLSTVTDGDRNYTYAYDGDGNRISKTVDGVTTDYYYIDGKLLGLKKGQDTLLFLYDETGTAYGFLRNGTPFYYAFNLQGDVIAIYNETGMEMVTYSYDVWGNHTCIIDNYYMGLANLNPLRYRGYFYDEETGFYYLQSRYYDPEVGRFISPDGYVSTGTGVLGYNMFAYCNNNPVNFYDPFGESFIGILTTLDALAKVLIICVVAILVYQMVGTWLESSSISPSLSLPKVRDREKDTVSSPPKKPPRTTKIYRYGGTNPGNLTPKQKDRTTGLSFSTIPPPGVKAAVTTIEALNATGVVIAIQDSLTHVTVKPVWATVQDWIDAGSNSQWTAAVKSVVVKWTG